MKYQVVNFEYESGFINIKNKLKTIILECGFKFPIQDLNHLLKGKEWGYRFDDSEEILVLLLQYSYRNEQETLIFDYFSFDTWKKHRVIIRYGRVIDTQIRKSHEFFDELENKNIIKTNAEELLYKIKENVQEGFSLIFPLYEGLTNFKDKGNALVIRKSGIYRLNSDSFVIISDSYVTFVYTFKDGKWVDAENKEIEHGRVFKTPFIPMREVGESVILSTSELEYLKDITLFTEPLFLFKQLTKPWIKNALIDEIRRFLSIIPNHVATVFHLSDPYDICVIAIKDNIYFTYSDIKLGKHTYFGSKKPKEIGYSNSKHGIYSPSDIKFDTNSYPIITVDTFNIGTNLMPLFELDILLLHKVHHMLSAVSLSDLEEIDEARVEKDKIEYELRSIDLNIESLQKRRAELEKSIANRLEKLFENNENECRSRK